jgi:hypothetical protein
MKRFRQVRVPFLVLLVLALLASAALWSQRQSAGFASPAECVEVYRDACAAGDSAKALACLGGPLRAEAERSASAAALTRELAGVVSWAQHEPEVRGTAAHVDVDRGRRDGVQRVRFRLERGGAGWLIVGIDPPKGLPTTIPYGTHISKVP